MSLLKSLKSLIVIASSKEIPVSINLVPQYGQVSVNGGSKLNPK